MSTRIEAGLRAVVLALYDEATLTAAAKGLTGSVGQLAVLRETASLARGPARRAVSEQEVMRLVLSARRTRRAILVPAASLEALGDPLSPSAAMAPPRRGRLAGWAMRSLNRPGAAALV